MQDQTVWQNTRAKFGPLWPTIAIVSANVAMLLLVAMIAGWWPETQLLILLAGLLVCSLGLVSLSLINQVARSLNTERSLRESEAKYRLLASNATDMVFVLDRQFARRYVSPASLELLGYGPEELVGTMPIQMIHPDDVEHESTIYSRMLAGLDRAQTICRIHHRDGRWVQVETSFRLVRDPVTREPLEICGTSRDISKRAAAEAAKRESETNFRLLAENANDVVTRCAVDGTWRYVSPAGARVFGIPHPSLIGKRTLDFVHHADRQAMRDRMRRLQAGVAEGAPPKFRIVRPGGEEVWLQASSHVVFDPVTDEVDGYISVLRDITENVQAEVVLRESEERYRLLLRSAILTQAIFMLDIDGTVVSWNESAQRVTGFAADQIIGQHFAALFAPEDVEHGEPARHLAIALETGRLDTELWQRRHDGSRFLARISLRAIREHGTLRGFATMTHDITNDRNEREQRELFIEAAPNGMMVLDEAGTILLANAVLERMFGYTRGALVSQPVQMLVSGSALAGQPHAATDLAEPGQIWPIRAGQELTGRRSDGSEISLEVVLSPVDTASGRLVVASLFDTSERKRAEAAQAQADVEMRSRLTIEDSNANLRRLTEQLVETRDRALQATHAKGQTLTDMSDELRTPLSGLLGYTQHLQMEGRLSGTQSAQLDAMLEVGRHLLDVITNVIELSGAEPERIPPKPLAFAASAPATLERSQSNLRPLPNRAETALRVLVVDDGEINRDVATSLLRAAGHRATSVGDAAAAVAVVSADDFDVVLMDVRMPGVDGLEAARRIRALSGSRGQVPIVALTAHASSDQVAACRQAGMGSHVSKPFTPETLIEALKRAASLPRARNEPALVM